MLYLLCKVAPLIRILCYLFILFIVLPLLLYQTTRKAEDSSKARSHAPMRTFKESEKSQKTVKSMIETKGGDKDKEQGGKKNKNTKKEGEWSTIKIIRAVRTCYACIYL